MITPWGYEEDQTCDVCGRDAGDCICPECPVCHVQGDPACYEKHHFEHKDQILRANAIANGDPRFT